MSNIIRKMRSKVWALSRLKQYGFSETELIGVYTTFMRLIAEYVSVVWHTLLTAEQAAEIEGQQTRALRQIFGYGLSPRKMLERSGLERLAKRRERACVKFANNCCNNPRFEKWFVKRPDSTYARRSRTYDIYNEPTARTDRYRNSALSSMRRALNNNGTAGCD